MLGTGTTTKGAADFTGVLVKRQYQPGQKFVQLIFRTPEGKRLAISRNAQLVRALVTGETYTVRGREYELAGKRYVHEPAAELLQANARPTTSAKLFMKRHVRAVVAAVGVLAIIATISTTALAKHGAPSVGNVGAVTANTQSGPAAIRTNGVVQGLSTTSAGQTQTAGTSAPNTSTQTNTQPKRASATPSASKPVAAQPIASQPAQTPPATSTTPSDSPTSPTTPDTTPSDPPPTDTPPANTDPAPTPPPTDPPAQQ